MTLRQQTSLRALHMFSGDREKASAYLGVSKQHISDAAKRLKALGYDVPSPPGKVYKDRGPTTVDPSHWQIKLACARLRKKWTQSRIDEDEGRRPAVVLYAHAGQFGAGAAHRNYQVSEV